MSRMLKDCKYNNVKILHEISCLTWFIDKHAKTQAQNAGDKACEQLLEKLYDDLKKYIDQLEKEICK